MNDDKVVDFRSRAAVTPRITRFRSDPPTAPWQKRYPVEINCNVSGILLIRGLASVGLCFRQDTRTETVVIMPQTIDQIQRSQDDE